VLAPWFEPLPATAGIHLVARLQDAWREDEVVAAARGVSVGLYGIRAYYAGEPAQQGVLFGYGATPVDAIERGATRLAALMPSLVA
jgi:GntR family transcriptional regulator / MocR family aminotransferase